MVHFPVEKIKGALVSDLGGLIAIESIKGGAEPQKPFGPGPEEALRYMLEKAEKMGLETKNMQGYLGYAQAGEGEQMLALLMHLDVVPAGDGWLSEPFSLCMKGDKLYGRGIADDKGPAMAALYALKLVLDAGYRLNKKVRLYFGCDEESGWGDIAYLKQHEKEPDMVISPDGGFPIVNREKGLLELRLSRSAGIVGQGAVYIRSIDAGTRPNIVPDVASCRLGGAPVRLIAQMAEVFAEGIPAKIEVFGEDGDVLVRSYGVAAHGARPHLGVNALSYLVAFLNVLPLSEGAAEEFVYALAKYLGTEYDGERLGLAAEDALTGPLTLNLGMLKFDGKEIWATLDCRYPICMEGGGVEEKLREAFSEEGMKVERIQAQPSHYVPEESALVSALKEVYEDCTGQKAQCMSTAGATYARAFRESVAFGPLPVGKENGKHGPNEFLEMKELLDLTQILANAIVKLAAEPQDR